MPKINSQVFRKYDIRGLYPEEINQDLAYALGRALVRFTRAKRIATGHDARLSSPELHQALIQGARDEGALVLDFGLAGTEMLYFATNHYQTEAGIFVTASHNAKDYNGFKIVGKNGSPITSISGLDELKNLTLKISGEKKAQEKVEVKKIDLWNDYIEFLSKIINPKSIRQMTVALDAENGVGGLIFKNLFKASNVKLIGLNLEPDGNFPKHTPNPLIPKNRQELMNQMKETKEAEIGFFTDGDADRIMVADENGDLINTDFIGSLIARKLLKDSSGGNIVWDPRRIFAINDAANECGGRLHLSRAGFAFITLKMEETGSLFGGEVSGHYFYRSYFNKNSSMLTILHLLDLMTKEKKPISEMVRDLREKYFSIFETNFELKEEEKTLSLLNKYITDKKGKTLKLDGITGEFSDWRFNFRRSNNPEALYRLNIEAKSKDALERGSKEIMEIIKKTSGIEVE